MGAVDSTALEQARLPGVAQNRLPIEGGAWPAGWYLVEGAWAGVSAVEPRLSLRIERSDGARDVIPLPARHVRRLIAPVVFTHAVSRAWIESGEIPAREISGLQLRRVGRLAAMVRMLVGLQGPQGTPAWKEIARTLHDAAASAFQFGTSCAGMLLVARYQRSLQLDAFVGPRAAIRHGWPWLAARRAELHPEHHLQALATADADAGWEATGEDPRFTLEDGGVAVRLRAGWYRLRLSASALAGGDLVAPALYPDYGDGFEHQEMIRLPEPDGSGGIDALLVFKWDVQSLRFDPSIRRGRFAIHAFKLQRLPRAVALLRMIVSPHGHDAGSRLRQSARAAAAFVRTLRSDGLSAAAADLYERQAAVPRQHGNYAEWVRRYDAIAKSGVEMLRRRAARIEDPPLISLLLPVFQTPEVWLRRCLDSVLLQAYPHWELCIADDASPDPRVAEVLREYAARDPRVRLVLRASNGHISAASNSALEIATGAFVGLLDHDDELRPHALLEVAEAIRDKPGVGLLYSDEDKIDAEGRRFQPYFKPDWNPDLLRSQNYVCHFSVIRADLIRAVGGFRAGFEGSQDHDLILRCVERLAPDQIHHIPKVLYHWRAIPGSTALERESKDYASTAGMRAVTEHLQRQRLPATVEELPHGHYRVRWAIPAQPPKVSIIIPTRDRLELLRCCVESVLARTDYANYEIVIVDNRSVLPATLAYLDELRARADVAVLQYDADFNYSAINNWAASQCTGELLCLLNNDVEVISSDWLGEMVGHALRPDIGAVGAMLYYPDDTIQHAGVILGIHGVAAHVYAGLPRESPGHGGRARVAQNLSAVTGACLLVRRETYERVGGLDESLQVAFNDIDFCLRLRAAGYRNLWTPFAELYHHESASRGLEDTEEKRQRFQGEVEAMQRRWGQQLLQDPAYNVNLSLGSLYCELSSPPRQ